MTDAHPVRLMDEAPFTLDGALVTPAARTLGKGTAESVIEPRVMQVLVTLYRRRGLVVGREALIDACWGGRAVGEDAINRAILKLRRALEEIGCAVPVETVAKVGYRLGGEPPAATSVLPARSPRRRWRKWLPVAGVAAVGALAAGLVIVRPQPKPLTSRVIVVQALRVTPGDTPARGLAQDFTSDLSRAVLGHDGRLEFADAQAGSGRGAAFTVTGSIASVGKDLHAVVAVSRRDDAAILWSHDYAAPLDEADGLRQQLGTNVAAVLVCALGTEGVPEQVDAQTTALYLETCNLHAGDHRREAYLLRQVIARAPTFAGAWADLALSLTFGSGDGGDRRAGVMRREALAAARHALALDPHVGRAYFAQALLLPGVDHWRAREWLVAAGLRAQPDCPQLYNMRGHDLAAIGRLQDSIESHRRSVALDPLYPGKTASLASTLATAGQLDEANAVIRHMRATWPDNDYTWNTRFQTAAFAGDPHEAEAMLVAMRDRSVTADEAAAWRVFLRAREDPTDVPRAVAALSEARRRGAVNDPQLIQELAVLGRPGIALDLALRLPPKPVTEFWFRSFLQPLRADPRFLTVAARQGLLPIWRETGLWPDFCNGALPYDCRTGAPRRSSPRRRAA